MTQIKNKGGILLSCFVYILMISSSNALDYSMLVTLHPDYSVHTARYWVLTKHNLCWDK